MPYQQRADRQTQAAYEQVLEEVCHVLIHDCEAALCEEPGAVASALLTLVADIIRYEPKVRHAALAEHLADELLDRVLDRPIVYDPDAGRCRKQ